MVEDECCLQPGDGRWEPGDGNARWNVIVTDVFIVTTNTLQTYLLWSQAETRVFVTHDISHI